jgi:hypothetical protein
MTHDHSLLDFLAGLGAGSLTVSDKGMSLQELLDHPFLRPTTAGSQASSTPGQVGLTRAQLKKLLAEVITLFPLL